MQINAFPVRGFEGSFRRAPGVKTHVIEAKGLYDPENTEPICDLCSRITCFGKDGTFQGTPQKDLPAIDEDVPSFRGDLPHPKGHLFRGSYMVVVWRDLYFKLV